MFDKILAAALFPGAYQIGNPTTTPQDASKIMEAVRMLPQHPQGLVRMLEGQPGVNGQVNRDTPENIWLSREGPNFKSQDPWRIAGTIAHESDHTQGGSEPEARRAQIAALQQMGTASREDQKFLQDLQQKLKSYEVAEQRGLYPSKRK